MISPGTGNSSICFWEFGLEPVYHSRDDIFDDIFCLPSTPLPRLYTASFS